MSFRMVQFKPGIFWKKKKATPESPPADEESAASRKKHNPVFAYSAYVTLAQSIVAHWSLVNTSLGSTTATDMKIRGTVTVAAFTTKATNYAASLTDVLVKDNDVQGASHSLLAAKKAIRGLILQGRLLMSAVLKDTSLPSLLPTTPQAGTSPPRLYHAATEFADVWGRANALAPSAGFTPPLLIGGKTLAEFQAMTNALLTTLNAHTTATNSAEEARALRKKLLSDMLTDMVDYRATTVGLLGPKHELIPLIPNVAPKRRRRVRG